MWRKEEAGLEGASQRRERDLREGQKKLSECIPEPKLTVGGNRGGAQ